MSRKEIHTEIEIDSAAERVWEVLIDLPAYPEWNPMIREASGELRPGARLRLHFQPPGQKGRKFRPKLLVVDPDRELRWQGNPGVPGLFESEHGFIIQPKRGGGTLLAHDMVFYGLLAPLLWKRLEEKTVGPFEEMNRALRDRVESGEMR